MIRRFVSVALLFCACGVGGFAAVPADGASSSAPSYNALSTPIITITAPPTTPAGQMCCVFITAPLGPGELSYTIEVGGKSVEGHLTKVSPGSYLLCFTTPGGTGGEMVTVTASSGGQSASASISVF